MRIRTQDGTELHAAIYGPDGAPSLVLAHGWMGTSAVWHHQIKDLAGEMRIITFDQRGHGQSNVPPGHPTSDSLALDLDAVLAQTTSGRDRVTVAGHSLGAMAVVSWAGVFHSDVANRVTGLGLINVGVEKLIRRSTLVPFPNNLGGLRGAIATWLLTTPLPLPAHSNPVLRRLVSAVALGPGPSPQDVALCTEMFLECPPKVRAAFGTTLATFNVAESLAALTVPTLIVAGSHDRMTPPTHARMIAGQLDDARLVELDGVGHVAPLEAHAEVTEQLRQLVTVSATP